MAAAYKPIAYQSYQAEHKAGIAGMGGMHHKPHRTMAATCTLIINTQHQVMLCEFTSINFIFWSIVVVQIMNMMGKIACHKSLLHEFCVLAVLVFSC